MTEMHPGYGNEPLETPFEDGKVLHDTELPEYDSQDEHFAAVDRLSDLGVANYADAAKRLGYSAEDYETTDASSGIDTDSEIDALFSMSNEHRTPAPGASVTLRERAYAVGSLMDGVSMQNKLSGATRSSGLSRYKNPAEVLNGMKQKAEGYRRDESRAVELLAKTAALRAVGFNEAEIAASEAGIRRNLSKVRGTGAAAVRLRNKQKNVTAKTSKKVTGY
ncbi:MAG: hypothetical protein ACREGE_01850 [Candidatus Microsaccharimonas sp.]